MIILRHIIVLLKITKLSIVSLSYLLMNGCEFLMSMMRRSTCDALVRNGGAVYINVILIVAFAGCYLRFSHLPSSSFAMFFLHLLLLVGALQYLTLPRPDIQYAVNHSCQFQQHPTETRGSAVKRILCYVQGTSHHGLLISPCTNASISAYSDADWGGSPDDRRSTTGYCVFFGINVVILEVQKETHCG